MPKVTTGIVRYTLNGDEVKQAITEYLLRLADGPEGQSLIQFRDAVANPDGQGISFRYETKANAPSHLGTTITIFPRD